MKKKSTFVALMATSLVGATLFGCSNHTVSIRLESDFDADKTYEYTDKEITFPLATAINSDGKPISYDVAYEVVSSTGETQTSEFPSFKLGVGDYQFIYSCQGQKLSYPFHVRDTTAPNIIFSNVPASLFYEAGMGDQPLPDYEIDDLSWGDNATVDAELYFTPGDGEKQKISYNPMNNRYPVTGFGTFEYVVTATDERGNKAIQSVTWLAKDYSWVDPSLEEGTLSDFNEAGYVNYIKTGDVNQYYSIGNNFTAESLETFEGAHGVFHLNMGFSQEGYNSVSIKLAKPYTYADLEGKYLSVRAYVAGDGLFDQFGFAGNHKDTRAADGQYRAEISTVGGLEIGQWKTYSIGLDIAKHCEMTADGSTDAPIQELQLWFRNQSSKKRMDLYLDSISIASKLGSTSLKVDDEISWDPVSNVDHYEVNLNGQTQEVQTTSIAVPEGKGYVEVTPKGDQVRTLDGDPVTAIYGVSTKPNYIAGFDDALYGYLWNRELDFSNENDNEGYRPSTYSSSLESDGLKLDVSQGAWGIVSGLRFQFPKRIKKGDYDSLRVTLKIEDTAYDYFRIYDYAKHHYCFYSGEFEAKDQGKFITYALDLSTYEPEELEGLTFIFGHGGGPNSAKVVATFQSIIGIKNQLSGVVQESDENVIGLQMKDGTFSASGSLDLSNASIQCENNNAVNGATVENNVVKLTLTNQPVEGEKVTIAAASTLAIGSDSYLVPEDISLIYLGGDWNLILGSVKLHAGYTTSTLVQFTDFFDLGAESDDTPYGFYGHAYYNGQAMKDVQVVGYASQKKTICFKELSLDTTGIFRINAGSYIYHNGKAAMVQETFQGVYNGNGSMEEIK